MILKTFPFPPLIYDHLLPSVEETHSHISDAGTKETLHYIMLHHTRGKYLCCFNPVQIKSNKNISYTHTGANVGTNEKVPHQCTRWWIWEQVLWIGEPLGHKANGLLRLSVLTEREWEEQTRRMPENTGSSLVTVLLSEEEKPTEADQSNYRHSMCQHSCWSHVFQSSSQHVWSLMMRPKGARCHCQDCSDSTFGSSRKTEPKMCFHVKNTHFWLI